VYTRHLGNTKNRIRLKIGFSLISVRVKYPLSEYAESGSPGSKAILASHIPTLYPTRMIIKVPIIVRTVVYIISFLEEYRLQNNIGRIDARYA
jgi:hypothetical protein